MMIFDMYVTNVGIVRETVETDLTIKKKSNNGKGRMKRPISINKQARERKQRAIEFQNKKIQRCTKGGNRDELELSLGQTSR